MYAFTDEQQMIRKLIRKWVQTKLEPKVEAFENGEPPYELMKEVELLPLLVASPRRV